jgi:probable F420-dependent oxidoreductase
MRRSLALRSPACGLVTCESAWMHLDTTIMGSVNDAAARAHDAEELGFDGVWVAETKHDPFLALAAASTSTSRVVLGTNIVVAFARSPMTVAMTANDVHAMSGGRHILGLGSQIKPHVTRRFSMPWSAPAARMKEYVAALRAIWSCWNDDETLRFEGEFYRHTLMTPMFAPEPNPHGAPLVYVAAVGPKMLATAGEVADGLLVHPFTSERYLREVIRPELVKAHGDLDDFAISGMPIVVTGRDEAEQQRSAKAARRQLAFYASTPAYRPVLDLHGWGDLQPEMHALSLKGEWAAMGERIDDEVLNTIALVAEPDQVGSALQARFGELLTRCSLSTRADEDPAQWASTLAATTS